MKKELKEKFEQNEWINQINEKDGLILSNDLDSLFSCVFLQNLFGAEIRAFYDFNDIYYNKLEEIQDDNLIGVDVSLYNLRAFDNHHVRFDRLDNVNKRSVNMNVLHNISAFEKYGMKYSGSTLLQILSYYSYESLYLDGHIDLTETQKMILLCIDVTFKGLYMGYEWHIEWCRQLGIIDTFKDVLNKYDMKDMYTFIKDYDLAKDIVCEDGKLRTSLNLAFIQEHFPMLDFVNITRHFQKKIAVGTSTYKQISSWESLIHYHNVFSIAVVGGYKAMITKAENDDIRKLNIFNFNNN